MDAATIARLPNLPLAESALHAPFAEFGEHEFYPEFVDKAAVLLERLARNHPLPDGNKRAAWVTLRVFVEINDWTWQPYPVDEAERAVLAIAAGEWDHRRHQQLAWRSPNASLPGWLSGRAQSTDRCSADELWAQAIDECLRLCARAPAERYYVAQALARPACAPRRKRSRASSVLPRSPGSSADRAENRVITAGGAVG
jgi:death-on-curing protein